MRMCAGSTAGGNWSESNAALHRPWESRGELPSFFFCQTAGKDLPRRRVNTVAMRKSATHDSRDRPATRRNWVGPGYYLGPEDGSIPSCASRCSTREPEITVHVFCVAALRAWYCRSLPGAVIWSIDVIGSISAFQADRAGSNPVCSSNGTHTPVLAIRMISLTETSKL